MINEAVILAGGLGTRLREMVSEIPKSMAPVNGTPFLEYQLNYLEPYGIERLIFSVGYLRNSIMAHFGQQFGNFIIDYAIEEKPLGTGGGIQLAFKQVTNARAFVLNGDTLFNVDLEEMTRFHMSNNADISIALREMEDMSRYGAVHIDKENRITGFSEKGTHSGKGLINGGIYIIEKKVFETLNLNNKFSMEKEVFEKNLGRIKLYGYTSKGYFLDIGIPEDYIRAQEEFKQLNK